jgi:hypothetical protein
MTQLFIQLVQSVTGAVITIVGLLLVAAIIGYLTAWYYAKSVYTPKIKALEDENSGLRREVDNLKGEIRKLNDEKSLMHKKIVRLEEELAEMSTGTYVVKKAKNGELFFHLKSALGKTILSSEMYTTRAACNNGIESVRKNCSEDKRYERKVSSDNLHFFNLKANNGQVIGTSEMYESEENMLKAIELVKKLGTSMTLDDTLA